MAKYNVTYACGCEGTVNLFGKGSERERKLNWLSTVDCPACAAKARMAAAQADETPVTIKVMLPTANVVSDKIIVVAVAEGGTYRRKDDLKALGFGWGECAIDTGLFNFLTTKRPEKCWHKIIKVDSVEDLEEALKFGEFKCADGFSGVDLELLRRGEEHRAEAAAKASREKERKEKIGQSPLQNFANSKGKFWNGKLYGKERDKPRIYVDNVEHYLPSDVWETQQAWYKHRDAVNAEYKEAV